jgi:hypothetical protein
MTRGEIKKIANSLVEDPFFLRLILKYLITRGR